jgi:hypothetical protein
MNAKYSLRNKELLCHAIEVFILVDVVVFAYCRMPNRLRLPSSASRGIAIAMAVFPA